MKRPSWLSAMSPVQRRGLTPVRSRGLTRGQTPFKGKTGV